MYALYGDLIIPELSSLTILFFSLDTAAEQKLEGDFRFTHVRLMLTAEYLIVTSNVAT